MQMGLAVKIVNGGNMPFLVLYQMLHGNDAFKSLFWKFFPFSSNPVPPRAAEPEFIDTSGTSDNPLCTSGDNPGKDWIKLYQINFVNRSGMVPIIDDEVKL